MPHESAFGYHFAHMTYRPAPLVLLTLAVSLSPHAQEQDAEPPLDPEMLEARNATIRAIRFDIRDVFDLSNPQEDKRLYRLANRLHIRTKQTTLESILLSEAGDPFSARLNDESARAIRARGFISEATIVPADYDERSNTVALDVTTQDSWSLSPDLKFSRSGGQNEYGLGLSEENLLGLGKKLTLTRSSDVDRDETFFEYVDPNLSGSRKRLGVVFADASDGHRSELVVGRPFFALDSRWALESSLNDTERVDAMYGLGEIVDEFRHDIESYSLWGGWSRGIRDGRTLRWLTGITADKHYFAPNPEFGDPLLLPEDRELVYPWIGFQVTNDDFRQMRELNDMGRTEDVALGTNVSFQLGYAAERFGSDRDALVAFASASKGWEPGGAGRLLLFNVQAQARRESGSTENAIATGRLRYYRRNLGRHLLTVSLGATLGNRLDAENQIMIGGDTNLRGYPLRYQSGERAAVFSVEQRFFSDVYLWRLVRIGYAVFADAGRVWGMDARGTPNLGTLYDVGVGLRLTSPRASSHSIVHVDLAFPINGPADVDSVQLTIEKKRTF